MYNYRRGIIVIATTIALFAMHVGLNPVQAASLKKEISAITEQTVNLDSQVLELALKAYHKAHADGLDEQSILTIIDFSKPSTEPRLWVVDLDSSEVLHETQVAHGKKTGLLNALKFSNNPGSNESSLGLYLTGKTYIGKNGYSLELHGLEDGINDNAYKRRIVMHGAKYATQEFMKSHGYLGRSYGCPALDPSILKPIVDTIKNGTLLFAYYPEAKWLAQSSYLN